MSVQDLGGYVLSVTVFGLLIAVLRGDGPKEWFAETKETWTRRDSLCVSTHRNPHPRNGDK